MKIGDLVAIRDSALQDDSLSIVGEIISGRSTFGGFWVRFKVNINDSVRSYRPLGPVAVLYFFEPDLRPASPLEQLALAGD